MVEILLVVAIMGIMATMIVPRAIKWEPNELEKFEEGISQVRNLAMTDGTAIMITCENKKLKAIRAEAQDVEDSKSILQNVNAEVKLVELKIKAFPETFSWTFVPESFMVYPDGTCQPVRLERLDATGKKELLFLTVTALLYKPTK